MPSSRFMFIKAVPSWMVSAAVHFLALLILALLTIEPQAGNTFIQISASGVATQQIVDLEDEEIALRVDEAAISQEPAEILQQLTASVVQTVAAPAVAIEAVAAPIAVELRTFDQDSAPKSDLLATLSGFVGGGGLDGRTPGEQDAMLARFGGNAASQEAVAMALAWFAEHQQSDGSWSFDHRDGPCQGRCADPGMLDDCKSGATAMALLAFLGAGHTHKQGAYQDHVGKGLYFLVGQMKVTKERGLEVGDFGQGSGRRPMYGPHMYAHGLASIALCEAYAMTQDEMLKRPAQLALNFITYAQDPVGGGWRYQPKQRGDTSLLGWQLMALKSGHMAYLTVDPKTIQGASKFLDSVQAQGGIYYGYTDPGLGQGTTAIGLLSRMYLGWKQDNATLKRGVALLSSRGPSIPPLGENMYYNYYATQVMRQYCGDPDSEGHEMWVQWNTKMRNWLIKSQDKSGHQKGSWMVTLDHGSQEGGRLYCTAMATMILEVYYRHMPIYGKQAAVDEFPL